MKTKESEKQIWEIDPTQTDAFVIFAGGLHLARMVKTYNILEDHIKFYLSPTQAMIVQLELRGKEDEDKFYDRVEDLYVREIPKKWLVLGNPHLLFQKWFAFCDWDLNYVDPFDTDLRKLVEQNKRLQAERDAAASAVSAMSRKLSKYSKHQGLLHRELSSDLAKQVKAFNVLALPDKKKEGEQ